MDFTITQNNYSPSPLLKSQTKTLKLTKLHSSNSEQRQKEKPNTDDISPLAFERCATLGQDQ
jgi:hypothetical protein